MPKDDGNQSTSELMVEALRLSQQTNARLMARIDALEARDAAAKDAPKDSSEAHRRLIDGARDHAAAHPIKVIPGCLSPNTKATFDAVLSEAGILIELRNYQLPASALVHAAKGGLVPDGLPIYDPSLGTLDSLSKPYRQWRATAFYPQDNTLYVGKPFADYLRPAAPAPVATPAIKAA
jgi:hypothetical protein